MGRQRRYESDSETVGGQQRLLVTVCGCARTKKRAASAMRPPENNPGSDLLSHTVTHAVPSAVAGLTSVFGMGTGVALLL